VSPSAPLSEDLQQASRALRVRGALRLLLLLVLLLLATWGLESVQADLRLASLLYDAQQGWYLSEAQPWRWLYQWGTVPGFLFMLGAWFLWYRGFQHEQWARWRPYLLTYALIPILGAGILVNGILKEHTGRPRPREVQQFGGPWTYQPPLTLGVPGKGRSFPCGHCTMGFVFSTGVVFWNHSRKLALGFLGLGLGYGALMSMARMAQGGHFFTDALWALGSLWIVMLILYDWILQPPVAEQRLRPMTSQAKRRLGVGLLVALGVMLGLYLTRRPFYEDHMRSLKVAPGVQQIEILSSVAPEHWKVQEAPGDQLVLEVEARGFALPDSDHYLDWKILEPEPILRLEVFTRTEGFFAELGEQARIEVPRSLLSETRIELTSSE